MAKGIFFSNEAKKAAIALEGDRNCGTVIANFNWQIENLRLMKTSQLKLAVTRPSGAPNLARASIFNKFREDKKPKLLLDVWFCD